MDDYPEDPTAYCLSWALIYLIGSLWFWWRDKHSCYCPQKTDSLSGKRHFKNKDCIPSPENNQMKSTSWITLSNTRDLVLIIGVILIAAQLILPSPYNPRYIFNLAFMEPHYICTDGTYSFAENPKGACSNHQGIYQVITPEGVRSYKK